MSVYQEFLRRWPHATALAGAQVRSIAAVIRPLGLVKRAPYLKQLGRALVEVGEVPSEPSELVKLPGLGPYAAHAVPIFHLGRDLPLVDWVIARVLRRVFELPEGRRPNVDPELWQLAERLAQVGRSRELWLGTLDFAAEVCKPRPLCESCPLTGSCAYFSAQELPVSVGAHRITDV